ncbi:MAG: penicillin-binding protein 2 [Patescibacteria group bacterium]
MGKKLIVYLQILLGWLTGLVRAVIIAGRPRSSDTGIFDPYVPLGSLRQVGNEYQPELSPSSDIDQVSFEDVAVPKRDFTIFKLAAVLAVGILAFRLVLLQITQGQENFLLAEGNRLKTTPVLSARGLLYDRNGVALVQNVPSFSLVLRPSELPRSGADRQAAIARIANQLGLPEEELKKTVDENRNRESVILKDGLSREEALVSELKLEGVSGVELATTPVRNYAAIASLSHTVGYVGKVTADELEQRRELLPISYIGKTGVEKNYDRILQGIPGVETLEVDSAGRVIRSIGVQPAQVGRSLLLTLDVPLQQLAASALLDSITKNGATSGAAVVLDVRSGDVLAMVSAPYFDNNIFSPNGDPGIRQATLNDPQSPLLNRAVAGQYPSGSTIKPVIAAAALQEGVISEQTRIDTSEGKITVGQWTFPDWRVHGLADVRQAIAESNNIFFYTVGGGHGNIAGLGATRLGQYLRLFGFGERLGIDLTGEATGLVPTPDWKEQTKKEQWYIGDTYNLAIGQGDLLVTPLQLTAATAAIANGGTLYQPKTVKKYLATERVSAEDVANRIVRDNFINPQVLQIVREGMRRTVESGSARSFAGLPIEVAAKTGTAQFNVAKDRTHSWFTAFAPYHNPEIAISVIVEGGGEGFSVAAPVAKNIIEQYFHLPLTPIVPATPTE